MKKHALHLKKKQRTFVVQFSEYMVGGALYFWSGYGVFALVYSGLHTNWFWAKVAGDIVGRTVNYLVQRYWTFARDTKKAKEGARVERYTIISVVSIALDYGIVGGLKWVGISPYVGQLISATFFTVWNWLWYRLWVFPRNKKRTR